MAEEVIPSFAAERQTRFVRSRLEESECSDADLAETSTSTSGSLEALGHRSRTLHHVIYWADDSLELSVITISILTPANELLPGTQRRHDPQTVKVD